MSKHTPGPWKYGRPWSLSYGCGLWLVTAESTDRGKANVLMQGDCQNHLSAEEAEANARLIAAAPDLLEALQAVVRVADRKTAEFDLARAALSRATGQE